MSKKSPMQLSLDYLNKCGFTCQIVERRLPIPGKHVTQDCFGFGDILAYMPEERFDGMNPNPAFINPGRIALVQTTSWTNFTTRKHKILRGPHFEGWKRAGGRIFLHGWGDKGLREEEL